MMDDIRGHLFSLSLFVAGWAAGYAAMILVFSHSPSASAYGLISGWWCALYCARVFELRLSVAAVAFPVYLGYAVLSVILDLPYLYHDNPGSVDFQYFLSAMLSAAMFVSPLIVDSAIHRAADIFRKGSSQAAPHNPR
jgi:hypothetical protein